MNFIWVSFFNLKKVITKMKKIYTILFLIFTVISFNLKAETVIMETSKGSITIELDSEKAPITVKNFLQYANDGFYDGLIFHRVIKGFMIQGGGFDKKMFQKLTSDPIKNESKNGLKNEINNIALDLAIKRETSIMSPKPEWGGHLPMSPKMMSPSSIRDHFNSTYNRSNSNWKSPKVESLERNFNEGARFFSLDKK